MTGMEIKALLLALLLAFGITVPLPDFVAGMVLAMAGAYATMLMVPPSSRLSMRLTLGLAVLFGFVGGTAYSHIDWLHMLPLQIVMFLAGAMSRWIAHAINSFGRGMSDNVGDFARTWRPPWASNPPPPPADDEGGSNA